MKFQLKQQFKRGDTIAFDNQLFKMILISTFILGMLAHAFCYFNTMYNLDSLRAINQMSDNVRWKLSLGRFMQPLNFMFRGYIVAPWLIGALSLFWLSLACYFIVKTLCIHSQISIVFLCGLMSTNYIFTIMNASYLHESDSFMLALLLAVLAVYCFEQISCGAVLTPVCIMLCCGFYQPYFAVTVMLFMIVIIKDILEGMLFQKVFYKGVIICTMMFTGLGLYYIVYKVVLFLTGVEQGTSYNAMSLDGFWQSSHLYWFFDAYKNTLHKIVFPGTYNPVGYLVLSIVFGVLAVVSVFEIVKKNRIAKSSVVFGVVIVLLMPFTVNIARFISATEARNPLMSYAVVFIFVLFLFVVDFYCNIDIETKLSALLKKITVVVVSVMIFYNVIYANQAYLEKTLNYESTLSTVTRLLDRIENIDDYIVGETEIVFVGDIAMNASIYTERTGYAEYYLGETTSLTYPYVYETYFEEILAYPINIADADTTKMYAQMLEVEEMSEFPATDSVKMIGEVIVVKLSE